MNNLKDLSKFPNGKHSSLFCSGRLKDGEYMAFGTSGSDKKSQMIGGDVTVAWMDHGTGKMASLLGIKRLLLTV